MFFLQMMWKIRVGSRIFSPEEPIPTEHSFECVAHLPLSLPVIKRYHGFTCSVCSPSLCSHKTGSEGWTVGCHHCPKSKGGGGFIHVEGGGFWKHLHCTELVLSLGLTNLHVTCIAIGDSKRGFKGTDIRRN